MSLVKKNFVLFLASLDIFHAFAQRLESQFLLLLVFFKLFSAYPQDWHLALQVKYWSGNVSSIGFSISPLNLSFNTCNTQPYRKVPKFSDKRKFCYINLRKIQTKRPNLGVFHQKDANRIANSEDPDQTAPRGAV